MSLGAFEYIHPGCANDIRYGYCVMLAIPSGMGHALLLFRPCNAHVSLAGLSPMVGAATSGIHKAIRIALVKLIVHLTAQIVESEDTIWFSVNRELLHYGEIMKVNKVAIVGGTHGNELTGTFLLNRWANNKKEITRESFTTKTLWANPKAFYENKRYIDTDLNRSFLRDDLINESIHTYEGNRAKVINALLGPKEDPAFDFIIDLHTSTSNMGITLVLFEGDEYNLRIAAFIKDLMPSVNLYYFKDQSEDLPYLTSIIPKRLALEIGPIPQGVLRQDIFEQANDAVRLALDYIHRVNVGYEPEYPKEVEVFIHRTDLSFPVDAKGNICAMVHRNLQDKDFMELKKGDPVFITINGEIITYEEDDIAYPVFINEAAYYEKKIALSLTDKSIMTV